MLDSQTQLTFFSWMKLKLDNTLIGGGDDDNNNNDNMSTTKPTWASAQNRQKKNRR